LIKKSAFQDEKADVYELSDDEFKQFSVLQRICVDPVVRVSAGAISF